MGLYNVAWVGAARLILSSPLPPFAFLFISLRPSRTKKRRPALDGDVSARAPSSCMCGCAGPGIGPSLGVRSPLPSPRWWRPSRDPSGNVRLRHPTSTPTGGSGPPPVHHGGAPEHGRPSSCGSASLVSISGSSLPPSSLSPVGLEEKGLGGGRAGQAVGTAGGRH